MLDFFTPSSSSTLMIIQEWGREKPQFPFPWLQLCLKHFASVSKLHQNKTFQLVLSVGVSISEKIMKWEYWWWKRRYAAAAAAAKSLQSCPTLCDPIDGSPPASPIPGILQARTLEWVAISFSNAWKWKAKVKSLSHIQLLATPWMAAYQAPPSMGFSRQEYWSGVPLSSPEKEV